MSSKLMFNPRNAYGEALIELGEKYKNLVVLDADLSKSTKTIMFAKKYPERFFEMGIAEANMISTAAGFASCGKIPFVSTFAVLAPSDATQTKKIVHLMAESIGPMYARVGRADAPVIYSEKDLEELKIGK